MKLFALSYNGSRIIQWVRNVAVHLYKVLEVIPTSVYTVKTELNNYTLYRYCTSTAVEPFNANNTLERQLRYWQPNLRTVALSAQRLSERTVL
jgi:hypothetical protein